VPGKSKKTVRSAKPAAKRAARNPTDALVAFCRTLPAATEDVKWENDLVFSVGGKMFTVMSLPDCDRLSFKVDPAVFDTMTGHNGIVPAPYMARHHWVMVTDRKKIPRSSLEEMIAESHRLVAAKLPRKTQKGLGLTDR
jgi:predicted DNA-binding protein (MmcQ/YjbR family)